MRYLALACDYDGTLATDGHVDEPTARALSRFRDTGRRVILVTGRELGELSRVFPDLSHFDRIVAENGAVLYRPASRETRILAERPPPAFVETLRARGVGPIAVGKVIVATWTPHEITVVEVIRELGLELQVIFNKGAVMILPCGVTKATGLREALDELELSSHNVVGVGDAENDHALLSACECGVAVANALPALKERSDLVTMGARSKGVVELIDRVLASDLAEMDPRLTRHQVLCGTRDDGTPVNILPPRARVLVAGTSGSGKSTLVMSVIERIAEQGYQFCLIDPEGDYQAFAGSLVLGDAESAPTVSEVLELLSKPSQSVIVNLLGVRIEDRPAFFSRLMPRLQDLRARFGRPHVVVVDEAHHLLPAAWDAAPMTLPAVLDGIFLVTVHPELLARAALSGIRTVIAIGKAPASVFQAFRDFGARGAPDHVPAELPSGEAWFWSVEGGGDPFTFRTAPGRVERRRHRRKYMDGELNDMSFYFRGPEGKLHLRAQNLALFMQLAEGLDDETWLHHLRHGDYSRWFREAIKDEGLADEVAVIETHEEGLGPTRGRAEIREAIERHFAVPA